MLTISKIKVRLITHAIVLGGLLVFQFFPAFWGISFPFYYTLKQFIFYFLWVGIFYGNLYFLAPRLLHRQKAILFFITVILLLIAMIAFNHYIDESFQIKARLVSHFKLKEPIGKESDIISDFTVLTMTLLLIVSSTIMGVSAKMQKDELLRKDLESDQVSTELAFLKAQINPHFLFNTLNSIFSLTAGNEPAHTAVYNLSKMMRYILYETEGKNTTLHKEIGFLKDYLNLMQLRLSSNIKVSFTVSDKLQDHDIAPMIFLPIVENAFKHGVSGVQACEIIFDLVQNDNSIVFTSTNAVFTASNIVPGENGIGLTNTRRRLELLYPGCYTLVTGPTADQEKYCVKLEITL